MNKKSVLMIGLEPALIDFSAPEFSATPGLTADKIRAGLQADEARLASLGYEPELCFTDLGATAAAVVTGRLKQKPFDCVVIGAGIRVMPKHFLLFEKLVNVVHEHAPKAKLCFNTKPEDTTEAVRRWVPPTGGSR